MRRDKGMRGCMGEPRLRAWSAAVAVAAAVLAMACMAGCGKQVRIDDGSPHVSATSIASGSDLSEAGQHVEARLAFDKPVKASGDVSGDLAITIDGASLDTKTMAVSAVADGSDLVVTITPAKDAKGPDSGVYFACYQGDLSIASKRGDGSLPSVTSADGSTAVIDTPATFLIPSGVTIRVDDEKAGSAESATPASATFTVTQFAQIRCCTWIQLAPGERAYKHNHDFLRDTEKGCASDIASVIESSFGDKYTVAVDGATVTLTARDIVDGQTIEPEVCEGPTS